MTFPPAPPPPNEQPQYGAYGQYGPPPVEAPSAPPREIRPVIALLITNLVLSVVLTVLILALHTSVIDHVVAHTHGTNKSRAELRSSLSNTIWTRVIGNLVVSAVYVFVVRALLAGRRRAYRRVLWIGIAGIIGLGISFVTPYPVWVHVEQALQMVVLAALLWFVNRPAVREHCVQPGGVFRGSSGGRARLR